ncbi:MAG: GTPase HflX, partial [Alphaproteobacteria bacterium]|nr:GTPase HflX [Alphaproteobacteria bacterium]
LEEVLEADIIVHVRDCSHPDTLAQKQDVENVLIDLGLSETVEKGMLEALNKIDLLSPDEQNCILQKANRHANEYPICAKTGEGVDALLMAIQNRLTAGYKKIKLKIPVSDGAGLALAYRKAQILERKDTTRYITLTALLNPVDVGLFDNFRVE